MSLKFIKLTRTKIRALSPNQEISEHGITFKRLSNGDGRYAVNIMVDGQRVHRVIGKESEGVTRKQVEDFIEKVRTDARHGRLNLPKGRKVGLSFGEAAKKYLERLPKENGKDIEAKTYRIGLHLAPFFKNMPLIKISTSDVEHYKRNRIEEKTQPGTINRELAVLSHLFNKAIEWKWIDYKPCKIKRFKEQQTKITYLTIDQIQRLLETAKKDQSPIIYPFILIGLETSMRRMEILRIKIKDIDIERRIIFIPKAKAGARQQPITKRLATFLQKYLQNIKPNQEHLFQSKKAKGGHMTNIEKPFRRVVAHRLQPQRSYQTHPTPHSNHAFSTSRHRLTNRPTNFWSQNFANGGKI